MSSTEGAEVLLRRAAAGGAGGSPAFGPDGATVVLRTSSVRRRGRGRAPAGVHGDQIRPHSILCDTPSDPTEVVLRRKGQSPGFCLGLFFRASQGFPGVLGGGVHEPSSY